MTYTVVVTPAADFDIASAFAYIRERSPLNAERWLRGLYRAVHKLERFPGRCARAREADQLVKTSANSCSNPTGSCSESKTTGGSSACSGSSTAPA